MRILIAEDDLTARTILAGLLKKWGYDLVIANDGLAAWEILCRADAPRLVILDWMMPGMDGLEVIRRARVQLIEQPPYIILITSRDHKDDVIAGLDTGANDYIRKPIDPDELLARVRVGQRSVEMQTSLYEVQKMLERFAIYDSLTGILNRRGILEQLSRELSRSQRGVVRNDGIQFSIGFFDIDRFKSINDQYGHRVGDDVLKGVVNLVASQLRIYDIFGRLGGDEFLVIAPEAGGEKSEHLYERLAAKVADSPINTAAGEISVTISMGCVLADPDEDISHLLDRVDTAMYRAKRSGGNQTQFIAKE